MGKTVSEVLNAQDREQNTTCSQTLREKTAVILVENVDLYAMKLIV